MENFSSLADVVKFIRSVPETENFALKIYNEQNLEIEATPEQAMYAWRYIIQGKFLGKEKSELIEYAVAGVNKISREFPHKKLGELNVGAISLRRGRKIIHTQYEDGTIAYCPKAKKFKGWMGGKGVVACSTPEKTREKMIAKRLIKAALIKIIRPVVASEDFVEQKKVRNTKYQKALRMARAK